MMNRNLQTGEVKSEFPPDVKPDWFNHRGYRSRATDQYFIASQTGLEFIERARNVLIRGRVVQNPSRTGELASIVLLESRPRRP